MAVQKGIIPFSGKLGNLVGFSRSGKIYSKEASGSYDLTEESKKSGKEFGRGSSAAALVRNAFEPLVLPPFRSGIHNRLSEKFREVIRSGSKSIKGTREVVDGNISLLKGFEFSSYARFGKLVSFYPAVKISVDSVSVSVPAVDWNECLNPPANATRAVFGLVCGFFDFRKGIAQRALSGNLVIEKDKPFAGAALYVPVPEAEEQVTLVMMNVFFEDGVRQGSGKIGNRLHQAAIILDTAYIRNGQLIRFEPETMIQEEKAPEITPDVNWELISPR